MELIEIIRAFLFVTAAVSMGICVLSFYTYFTMKRVPKKERNLMEFQKIHQYVTLSKGTLVISLITLLLALWI